MTRADLVHAVSAAATLALVAGIVVAPVFK
jgi:hypothetical protein